MDSIYGETISSLATDLDNLWRDKNAFSSVKSLEGVSIEDANLCSYNRFILSTTKGGYDDVSVSSRSGRRGWGPLPNQGMSLIDRLAKTVSIWTLPDLSRMQADKILHDFEPGIFLVRMTTDKKTMVLSYRMEERAQHVMIKVDPKKGFYMDGSQHVFRNVNHMIAHYMKHPLQNPDLCLKLPRALMEACEAAHFQFFENMKINFWTTLLANKSIDEIWSKPIHDNRSKDHTTETTEDVCPPVPPRGYHLNELHILQGLAEVSDSVDDYQQLPKKRINKPKPPPKSLTDGEKNDDSDGKYKEIYSQLWQWQSESDVNKAEPPKGDGDVTYSHVLIQNKDNIKADETPFISLQSNIIGNEPMKYSIESDSRISNPCFTIPKLIEKYYPQIIHKNFKASDANLTYPSLQNELIDGNRELPDREEKVEKTTQPTQVNNEETVYQGQYETPWDVKNSWLTKLIDMDNRDADSQNNIMNEMLHEDSTETISRDKNDSLPRVTKSEFGIPSSTNENAAIEINQSPKRKHSTESLETDDEEEELAEDENRLQLEFLGEIESEYEQDASFETANDSEVIYSPTSNSQMYSPPKSQYGQSIRNFLTRLCSRRGSSQLSQSVRLFISCTINRNDLSPYTTMRLIRQYMSGLKNLITKNKDEFSLNVIINEEIKNTPKNVFINLDSIIESVLTKAVVKPLKVHVYRLLVLEHYKNNNLKLIADGVETCRSVSLEKLGLKDNVKIIIDSKLDAIRHKFYLISKQYSPERKIKYMISIVDIVFGMLKSIYPETDINKMQNDIKSDSILPLFVYIFSQCKLDAVSTQCEVEYVEGLIWSSRLVNGEPGFFLLNLMSALEAVKVLARPQLQSNDLIDLSNKNAVRINNSSFFSKINPSSLSEAAVGSVNVIILDEKINRLVTKTFPVRSTVTVASLCNTIAHRLGIFNPKDYCLFKYTGFDEYLLNDHECPLVIKQTYQQSVGENINFLFKRKDANFILPLDIKT